LNEENITFSDGFEFKVMNLWKIEKEQLFDQSFKMILFAGITAALLLMINLYVAQNSLSIDALFGIVEMNANNTTFLLL
tara:strand:- start:121 stop:357 length:237 start_codon:yes stop_codon:yes gene_type:complete